MSSSVEETPQPIPGHRVRVRVINALYERFVGAGCYEVTKSSDRYAGVHLPGYKARITANLSATLRVNGLRNLARDMAAEKGILFAVPYGSQRLEEGVAIIPIDEFIRLYANQKDR